MKILFNKRVLSHNVDDVADGAYRLREFTETVSNSELMENYKKSEDYIQTIHPTQYLEKIKKACQLKSEMAEVKLSPESYEAILVSVALSIMAADQQDFAVIRPSGHHASSQKAEGFCFINNEAITTQHLLDQGKTVAIIDFDGHHGNGTQEIFKDEDRVFFASVHQFGKYPHTGFIEETGEGPSLGKVINIPLLSGSGDDLLIKSIKFILGKIKEFNPDYLCVVAGVDGYGKDKLLSLNYSKQGFYEIGKIIADFNKPTFAILAGGYHNEVKSCVDSFIAGFNKEKFDTGEVLTVSPEDSVDNLDGALKYFF